MDTAELLLHEAAELPPSVLLLDNYDSYTYNLAQLIAQLCGRPPITVRNDEWQTWAELKAALPAICAVVISPGPGDPTKQADFGVCAAAIRECGIPVLGVCLGHQGMAAAFGAAIVHAPQVMHGRLSQVTHDGDGLFAGVPSPVTVVRYHSLAVERASLPSCLRITATSEDDCVMALAHESLPMFGVQFHPESVCTEHGALLVRNFLALARASCAPPTRAPTTARRVEPRALCNRADGRCLLVAECPGGGPSVAARVFAALFSDAAVSFWLDSSDAAGTERRARFSYMGCLEGPHSFLLRRSAKRATTRTSADGEEQPAGENDVLASMRAELNRWGGAPTQRVRASVCGSPSPAECDILPAALGFRGGFVGCFAYEAWRCVGPAASAPELEQIRRAGSESEQDEACFLFADRVLAFDHQESRVHLLCLHDGAATGTQAHLASAQAWLDRVSRAVVESVEAEEEAEEEAAHRPSPAPAAAGTISATASCSASVVAAVANAAAPSPAPWSAPSPAASIDGPCACAEGSARAGFQSVASEQEYVAKVGQIRRHLHAGDSYEVCLTTSFTCERAPAALPLYLKLRELNPAPYAAFLNVHCGRLGGGPRLGPWQPSLTARDYAICCSSPERFLRVGAAGDVESKPIKGTAPRGATPAADAEIASSLAASPKERAENLMIVDLIRNDLGRVCVGGSVSVPSLMAVETFATVHQLVSTIRGTLAPDLDALDVCAASFPPGSMTGAPKVRTMRLIDELEEGAPRGAYSGCLGFFSVHGAADLNVVIRTAVVSQQGVAIGAGGAVVDMSDARQEWEEVLLKARTPMRAVATCLAPEGLGVDVALGVGVG